MNRTCLLAVAAALAVKQKQRKRRSKWIKGWLLKLSTLSHVNLLEELKLEPQDWHNYLRMDEETYLNLLKFVTPLIKKTDTHMRQSINPHERLTATLRFLATGRSYEDLKFSTLCSIFTYQGLQKNYSAYLLFWTKFLSPCTKKILEYPVEPRRRKSLLLQLISAQSLGQIIPETCEAIYSVLKDDYLKFPKTEEEWKVIARNFEDRWNFPNCLGAVDGKHVNIVPPFDSGSFYWNYKGRNSLVLMAIVNANYEFIMVHFGANGRVSDGGVIENTTFYDKLKSHTLQIPPPCKPKDSEQPLPFVFVGDEAFALREDFLKPFSQQQLNRHRRIFNYRLSRCRRMVENVFGILASTFRIFHTSMNMKLETIDKVVMGCCVFHNFLRRNNGNNYLLPTFCDTENMDTEEIDVGLRGDQDILLNLQRGRNRHPTANAAQVRERYMEYFCNDGMVPWQDTFI